MMWGCILAVLAPAVAAIHYGTASARAAGGKPHGRAMVVMAATPDFIEELGPDSTYHSNTAAVAQAYARRHGFGFRQYTIPKEFSHGPQWFKIAAMHMAMNTTRYNYYLWLDSDAVIVNSRIDFVKAFVGHRGCRGSEAARMLEWGASIYSLCNMSKSLVQQLGAARKKPFLWASSAPFLPQLNTGAFVMRRSPEAMRFAERWFSLAKSYDYFTQDQLGLNILLFGSGASRDAVSFTRQTCVRSMRYFNYPFHPYVNLSEATPVLHGEDIFGQRPLPFVVHMNNVKPPERSAIVRYLRCRTIGGAGCAGVPTLEVCTNLTAPPICYCGKCDKPLKLFSPLRQLRRGDGRPQHSLACTGGG